MHRPLMYECVHILSAHWAAWVMCIHRIIWNTARWSNFVHIDHMTVSHFTFALFWSHGFTLPLSLSALIWILTLMSAHFELTMMGKGEPKWYATEMDRLNHLYSYKAIHQTKLVLWNGTSTHSIQSNSAQRILFRLNVSLKTTAVTQI